MGLIIGLLLIDSNNPNGRILTMAGMRARWRTGVGRSLYGQFAIYRVLATARLYQILPHSLVLSSSDSIMISDARNLGVASGQYRTT